MSSTPSSIVSSLSSSLASWASLLHLTAEDFCDPRKEIIRRAISCAASVGTDVPDNDVYGCAGQVQALIEREVVALGYTDLNDPRSASYKAIYDYFGDIACYLGQGRTTSSFLRLAPRFNWGDPLPIEKLPSDRVIGLSNYGNTCFINAALQCFFNARTASNNSNDDHPIYPNLQKLIDLLYKQYYENKPEAVNWALESVISAIRIREGIAKWKTQGDPADVINVLTQIYHGISCWAAPSEGVGAQTLPGLFNSGKELQGSVRPPIVVLAPARTDDRGSKLTYAVNVPESLRVGEPGESYDLTGFIVHERRDFTYGHYINYVRSGENFYLCNDTTMQQISKEEFIKAAELGTQFFLSKVAEPPAALAMSDPIQ